MPAANTVSIPAGGTVVSGNLTLFVGAEDDTFFVGGLSAPIASVDSASQITLKTALSAAAITNATYAITRTGPFWNSTVTTNEKLTELLAKIDGAVPFVDVPSGTLAQRAQYDSQPQGFKFLQIDVSPFLVFVKKSATSGDWTSPGQRIQGDQAASTTAAQAAASAASGSQSAAAGSANAAASSASAASGSASASSVAATLSQAWATQPGTSEVVTGQGYSAKAWAAAAASSGSLAQAWATQVSGEVVAGQGFSARYWAAQAAANAATVDTSSFLTKAGNFAGLTDVNAARNNLVLGNSSTRNVGTAASTVAAGDDSRITGAAQKTNNGSDFASPALVRTNIGAAATAHALDVSASGGTEAALAVTPAFHLSADFVAVGAKLQGVARAVVDSQAGNAGLYTYGLVRCYNLNDGTFVTTQECPLTLGPNAGYQNPVTVPFTFGLIVGTTYRLWLMLRANGAPPVGSVFPRVMEIHARNHV